MINKTAVVFGFLLSSSICFGQKQNDSITLNYQSDSQSFHVSHCFQKAPAYMEAHSKKLQSDTDQLMWNERPRSFNSGYVELPENQSGCFSYQLKSQAGATNRRLKNQHTESILLKIDELLWQPNNSRQRALPHVKFIHNKNTSISAPWQLLERGSLFTKYQMKPSPRYSDGFLAVGSLASKNITLRKSTLRVSVMPGKYQQKTEMINQWVKTMASSVADVSGTFPLNDVQVLVIMIDGNGGEVPWGQVNRAGGDGVLFVVNGNATKADLYDDWTAAHEFSHLLTPYTPDDRWLSEGFASYHQNISRLKTGLLDEKAAWSKLIEGFERGKKSASNHNAPALKHANQKNIMQMYWGGAVIALKAEIALQQQTQGKTTLSDALAGLQDCCLSSGRGWSASDLFKELDRISNTHVFTNLYETEVKQKPYPEYQELMTALGIKRDNWGGIELDNSAPLAEIRQNLTLKVTL